MIGVIDVHCTVFLDEVLHHQQVLAEVVFGVAPDAVDVVGVVLGVVELDQGHWSLDAVVVAALVIGSSRPREMQRVGTSELNAVHLRPHGTAIGHGG